MGRLFTLSPSVVAMAKAAFSDLLDQLGKDCLLVYPPLMVPCDECGVNNTWVTGGPMTPADGTTCPLCDGSGLHARSHTETVRMLLAYSPRDFFKPFPAGVQVPDGLIQAKAYIGDATKLMQAREMVVQPALQHVVRWRYVLDGEVLDASNIVQGAFVISNWKRAG